MPLEQDEDAMSREDGADLRLDELVVARWNEEMRYREPPVLRERRIDLPGRERVRPQLARDVGQDAGAGAFTVDGPAPVGEAFKPAERLGEDLARRRAIFARDRYQRAGVAFVVHGGTLSTDAGSVQVLRSCRSVTAAVTLRPCRAFGASRSSTATSPTSRGRSRSTRTRSASRSRATATTGQSAHSATACASRSTSPTTTSSRRCRARRWSTCGSSI